MYIGVCTYNVIGITIARIEQFSPLSVGLTCLSSKHIGRLFVVEVIEVSGF